MATIEPSGRPGYSKWFADVASTPGLSKSALVVACRAGAIGMGKNACGRRLYFESSRKVAELTGLDRRNVRRGLAELVEAGLLRVVSTGGGRGRATRYQLIVNYSESRALLERAEKAGGSAPVSGAERGAGAPPFATETGAGATETGVGKDRKRGRQDPPNPKESKKNGPAPPPLAAGATPEAKRPNAMRLARSPRLVVVEGGGG